MRRTMLRQYLADESGQTAAEYLLIVGLGIAVVVAAAVLATQMRKYVQWAESAMQVARDSAIAMLG